MRRTIGRVSLNRRLAVARMSAGLALDPLARSRGRNRGLDAARGHDACDAAKLREGRSVNDAPDVRLAARGRPDWRRTRRPSEPMRFPENAVFAGADRVADFLRGQPAVPKRASFRQRLGRPAVENAFGCAGGFSCHGSSALRIAVRRCPRHHDTRQNSHEKPGKSGVPSRRGTKPNQPVSVRRERFMLRASMPQPSRALLRLAHQHDGFPPLAFFATILRIPEEATMEAAAEPAPP